VPSQFDLAQPFDLGDHLAQMLFEIIAGVDRQGRIIDWSAVGNHHQDAALLGTLAQPVVRPGERLAVDVDTLLSADLFEDDLILVKKKAAVFRVLI
jgi:hypothetical protein